MSNDVNNRTISSALDKLWDETGIPFWKDKSEKHSYSVILAIPGVRSDEPETTYTDFLHQAGLDKGKKAELLRKDSVRKELRAPGDIPPTDYTLVLRGNTPEEFTQTVDTFLAHFPKHAAVLNDAWLQASPSPFIEALKEAARNDDRVEALERLNPTKAPNLRSWLQELSKQAVSREQPRQASLASTILDIIDEHVPALHETIHSLRGASRIPAILNEDTSTQYLTDTMKLQKNGFLKVNPFPGYNPHIDRVREMKIAKISRYEITFQCPSTRQAEELRQHLLDGLKDVAKSEPHFGPNDYYKDDRPTLNPDGSLNTRNCFVYQDGKNVKIRPPLILDDVWKLYESVADVIKPSLQVAQAMDWARRAEYRSAVEGFDENSTTLGKFDARHHLNPGMVRGGGYDTENPSSMYDGMRADIAGMAAASGDAQTAAAQLTQLAHLTLQGVAKDPDGKYGDMFTMLPGHKTTAVTRSQYAPVLQQRTAEIAADFARDLEEMGVNVDRDASLKEQLETLTAQGASLKTRDKAIALQREIEASDRAAQRRATQPSRLFGKDEKSAAYEKRPTHGRNAIIALTGGLGKAEEQEAPLLDRPYPLEYYNDYKELVKASPEYWSRSGELSLTPPRFELPRKLQETLNAARAAGKAPEGNTVRLIGYSHMHHVDSTGRNR